MPTRNGDQIVSVRVVETPTGWTVSVERQAGTVETYPQASEARACEIAHGWLLLAAQAMERRGADLLCAAV